MIFKDLAWCKICRVGNSLIFFLSKSLIFCKKHEQKWAIFSNKWAIRSFANFWWATWAIRSQSLIPSERPGERPERFAHFAQREWTKEKNERFTQKSRGICSFALLWWVTRVNHSHLLICPKWLELITHICSFVLSDLSGWANERIPNPENLFLSLFKSKK